MEAMNPFLASDWGPVEAKVLGIDQAEMLDRQVVVVW
jgi:hypothetical protein